SLRLALHQALRLALGADKNGVLSLSGDLGQEVGGSDEAFDRLPDVDDVDQVPLPEDVRLHLRVPAAHSMAEMNSGLYEVLHLNYRQGWLLSPGETTGLKSQNPRAGGF